LHRHPQKITARFLSLSEPEPAAGSQSGSQLLATEKEPGSKRHTSDSLLELDEPTSKYQRLEVRQPVNLLEELDKFN